MAGGCTRVAGARVGRGIEINAAPGHRWTGAAGMSDARAVFGVAAPNFQGTDGVPGFSPGAGLAVPGMSGLFRG